MDVALLRPILADHFGLEDLEVLCADVQQLLENDGIPELLDLEVIGARDAGKDLAILKLVKYLDRRRLLRFLVVAVLEARRYALDEGQRRELEGLRDRLAIPSEPAQREPLSDYRNHLITSLNDERYHVDKEFVHLTLMKDQGRDAEGMRFTPQAEWRFDDLRQALDSIPNGVMVLLGKPGGGKSTLLRRLQLDDARERLMDDGKTVSFFISLNEYRGALPDDPPPDPKAWLAAQWQEREREREPGLPTLDALLREGRLLLLLDALNEMPHADETDFSARIESWRLFLRRLQPGNRVAFSCRTLDYSQDLGDNDLPVQQVYVNPMTPPQIHEFLRRYIPDQVERVYGQLERSPEQKLLDFYSTPYFLSLLVKHVQARGGDIPRGRAELFTGFVRQALKKEVAHNELLAPDPNGLLDRDDRAQITRNEWASPHDLPSGGCLIRALSDLAYGMQLRGVRSESGQVLAPKQTALSLIAHPRAEDVLNVGSSLNVLDPDAARRQIKFYHQLLQEFFAARVVAQQSDVALAQSEWRAGHITPSVEDTLADPKTRQLPDLPTTGWEETFVTAAAMCADGDALVRALMAVNLPLAARCAIAPDVTISAQLKQDVQWALVERTQDMAADLRARIAAGLALGDLGDPRFEQRTGPDGKTKYVMPPLVEIEAGDYPIGDDEGYDDEKPAHAVWLDAFQIGAFPVTNAEFKCFVDAGGYDDERWWETDAAKAWRRGEGAVEGRRESYRQARRVWQEDWTDEEIRAGVPSRFTEDEADTYIEVRNMTDEAFEALLEKWAPQTQQPYTQPEYFDNPLFNNPNQPVVGGAGTRRGPTAPGSRPRPASTSDYRARPSGRPPRAACPTPNP